MFRLPKKLELFQGNLKLYSTEIVFFLSYVFFILGTEYPREYNQYLYYWAEKRRQHTQVFNIKQIPKP